MNLKLGVDGYPVLDQFSADGYVDLTFQITRLADEGDFYSLSLAASYCDEVLGMEITFDRTIESGFDNDMNLINAHVYRKGVSFIRSGAESDRLISAIGHLYGMGSDLNGMVDRESFTAIALHQGDLDFSNMCVKLKLFGKGGEPLDEEAYYESFLNVDLKNRLVYWNEKDIDYRKSLLEALTRK
ncbi:hypothetical protein [Algisphaera agarilytica]|uniref:Uncharacterized protein n=1 Tax=Algisphaera agarilytica TaxID=1385975 RepID=A0A7X0H3H3_9BACT|nr:hypothetical protein [Algisphaera agarilytica]MBB6428377.1 hypothetical protein [Algisphaera agarilytica]